MMVAKCLFSLSHGMLEVPQGLMLLLPEHFDAYDYDRVIYTIDWLSSSSVPTCQPKKNSHTCVTCGSSAGGTEPTSVVPVIAD